MGQENIMFFENDDKSYTMIDLYLYSRFFGYEDSYDIDVDKILYEKSDNGYVIRYHDVNKRNIVPLQLKIKNFCCEIDTYTNNNRVMFIYSDDKKLFRKCREIWNKITELIGINNAPDFLKNTIDDDANELIMVDVHKNTSFVGGNYRNKLIIVLDSVINSYLKASLVQVKIHKCI